jgi:hypothetical protein
LSDTYPPASFITFLLSKLWYRQLYMVMDNPIFASMGCSGFGFLLSLAMYILVARKTPEGAEVMIQRLS